MKRLRKVSQLFQLDIQIFLCFRLCLPHINVLLDSCPAMSQFWVKSSPKRKHLGWKDLYKMRGLIIPLVSRPATTPQHQLSFKKGMWCVDRWVHHNAMTTDFTFSSIKWQDHFFFKSRHFERRGNVWLKNNRGRIFAGDNEWEDDYLYCWCYLSAYRTQPRTWSQWVRCGPQKSRRNVILQRAYNWKRGGKGIIMRILTNYVIICGETKAWKR